MGDGFNPYMGRLLFFCSKKKAQKTQNPVTQVQVSEPKTEAPMNLHQLRKAAENNDLHLGLLDWIGLDWIFWDVGGPVLSKVPNQKKGATLT